MLMEKDIDIQLIIRYDLGFEMECFVKLHMLIMSMK